MQTVKTAAIVVLLMTGIYGTYVSLTTPPEPLPEEVQAMLDFDPEIDFAIDAGVPESMGTFAFSEDLASPSDNLLGSSDPVETQPDAEQAAVTPSPSLANPADVVGGNISSSAASDLTVSSPPQTTTQPASESGNAADLAMTPSQATSPSSGSGFALTSGTSSTTDTPMEAEVIQNAGLATESMTPNLGLENAIQTADRQFVEDKRRDALATLSIFYNAPNMTGEQRSELLSRLDPLAREVIYSKRHLLEQPHRVGQNETLMDIASIYQVPWQLLANINHVNDPITILPGTDLKVVRGPFRAEVNLAMKEITLFLGDLYAGRFPIEVGSDPIPKEGTYTVQGKKTDKTFYDRVGTPIPAGNPNNPYGDVWMDLGGMLSIHGSPASIPTDQGCISLASESAKDLYGILSQGSSVTIRR